MIGGGSPPFVPDDEDQQSQTSSERWTIIGEDDRDVNDPVASETDTDDSYDVNDALAAAEAAGAAASRAGAAVRASEAAEAAAHAIDIVEAENLVVATAQAVVAAEAAAGGRSGSERVEFLAVSRQRLFRALVELGLLREQAQARDAATSTGGAVEVISPIVLARR